MTEKKKEMNLFSSILWIFIGIVMIVQIVSNYQVSSAHKEKMEAIEQQTKELEELNRLIRKHGKITIIQRTEIKP